MTAFKSETLLLKIGDGQSPTEGFTTIGGLRTTRVSVNREVVTATDVTSQGWRRALAGVGNALIKIQGAGVFLDSSAEEMLREKAMNGGSGNYALFFGNGDTITGAFIVRNYERNGKVGEMEGFTVALESVDVVNYASA
ncbi:MAG: phage tail protein [Alphaproteobacteria bacterium]|nr:phage tail protein [Alphaproteobacteria bacterium]